MLRQTRQLSSQLEVEAGDNAALRTRLHAMEDDKETRLVRSWLRCPRVGAVNVLSPGEACPGIGILGSGMYRITLAGVSDGRAV